MAFSAGAIFASLSLDRTKFSAAMKSVAGEVKGFGSIIQKNSAQIKKMGRNMTVAGGAIVGTMGLMVKAYGTFDEAMTKSLAIMGKVSPAMRTEMAKTAKQLSTETTFAAKDLAEAYFFLASAGMSAEASVSALAPVARFAQAGTFDLAQATDLLTDAQTALGLSSTDIAKNEENLIRVSDVLVGANTLANASVLQFSESLTTKAAAALVNVNKEVEEGVAVLAAYADKGVKGRLAGTRLTMMLNGLFAATRENKKAWDEAGISLFEADGSMRSIADIIGDMEGYLGTMTVKEREATLATLGFNVRTKDSILTLMGSSEKIKEWTKKLKEMGGITKTVADKQMEAFNAKMTVAKNTIVGAAISIGKSLAPMIVRLTARVKTIAERISAWIEKHPRLTAVIAKVALGIGALLTVLGPLMMMLPGIIAALPALGTAFSMLLGPVGAVAVAATAVGIALNKLIENYKTKQDAEINAIIKATTPMAKAMAVRKKLIADEIMTIDEWREIFNKHGRSYKRVLRAISMLPEYAHIKNHLDALIKKQEEAGASAETLAGVYKSELSFSLRSVGSTITESVLPAVRNMAGVLEGAVKEFKKVPEEIVGTWDDVFWRILNAATLFTSSLGSLFDQMTTNQMARIDAEYEARKAAIDKSMMTEKSKADAMEKLNADVDKKRKKAERASAKRTKAVSLMEAIVGTAAAVVQAMKAPFPLSLILPIIIGAMGAAQIALIAATPLPTFQRGGRIGEEGGIVGEAGPELFVPERAGAIIPLRERALAVGGFIRPVEINISVPIYAMDSYDVDRFIRERGLPAIVEAIRLGIQKPEMQDALRIK